MKPRMSTREIRLIERALLHAGKSENTVHVLEWGSGGSTIHFTRYMRDHGIPYRWESIEYNKKWLEKVRKALNKDPDTHIAFFDVGNEELKQRDIPMNEYVSYPNTLGRPFDVIIVDGRKRRRCLLEAQKLVKEGGSVFLHDAQRAYYHSAFDAYANHSFISCELWRGNNKNIGTIQRVINILRSLFYTGIFTFFVYPIRKTIQHIRAKYRLTKDTLTLLERVQDKIKVLYALMVVRFPVIRSAFRVQIRGRSLQVFSYEYASGSTLYTLLKRAHDVS